MSSYDMDSEDDDRVFVLAPSLSRFIPQHDEQVLGPRNTIHIRTDYDIPPSPDTPDKLQFTYCRHCNATWLVGNNGSEAAKAHPSHNTHYHDFTGQSRRSLVVHVDGACPGNGPNSTRSSIGVYFGHGSSHNISRLLPESRPTNQTAELSAAIAALQHVRTSVRPQREVMVRAGPPDGVQFHTLCRWEDGKITTPTECLRNVWHFRLIIATDSAYLVNCLCQYRKDWTFNAQTQTYYTRNGKAVKNSALFAELVKEIDLISRVGVQVQWYFVPREFNKDADALANAALAPRALPNQARQQPYSQQSYGHPPTARYG
jgi:ribonuclease HI